MRQPPRACPSDSMDAIDHQERGRTSARRTAGEPAPHVEMDEAPRRPGKPVKDHGIRPGDIVGAITGETDLVGHQISAIEIHDSFSLVDVPQALAAKVIEVMSGCQIKGHPVFIKPDKDKGGKKKD